MQDGLCKQIVDYKMGYFNRKGFQDELQDVICKQIWITGYIMYCKADLD